MPLSTFLYKFSSISLFIIFQHISRNKYLWHIILVINICVLVTILPNISFITSFPIPPYNLLELFVPIIKSSLLLKNFTPALIKQYLLLLLSLKFSTIKYIANLTPAEYPIRPAYLTASPLDYIFYCIHLYFLLLKCWICDFLKFYWIFILYLQCILYGIHYFFHYLTV